MIGSIPDYKAKTIEPKAKECWINVYSDARGGQFLGNEFDYPFAPHLINVLYRIHVRLK